jgi:hypothetical protein
LSSRANPRYVSLHIKEAVMKRLIVLGIISIGACAIVDDRGGAGRDEPSRGPAVADTEQVILTCNGSPGQWPGCRGNGCAVCAELVGNAPCYFINHPACARNTTCNGSYFTCNDACPQPNAADFCSNCFEPPPCGNGRCDPDESCSTCPGDCPPVGGGTCRDGTPCCDGVCHDGSFCM